MGSRGGTVYVAFLALARHMHTWGSASEDRYAVLHPRSRRFLAGRMKDEVVTNMASELSSIC
jgi:hypothetical protein